MNRGISSIIIFFIVFQTTLLLSSESNYPSDILPSYSVILSEEKSQGYPGLWKGRFIWDDGKNVPYHYHLMARRTFTIKAAPNKALLRIAVCDRYRLYINGIYVGRGASRISRPQWMPYTIYDVNSLLRSGKNTVAVLAHHYGCPNSYTTDLRAGIYVELEMTQPDGEQQIVTTDEDWRVRSMKGYRRDTPVINKWQGVACEIFDAGQDPANWMQPSFDDSDWSPARVLVAELEPMHNGWAYADDSPWVCLEPRRVPMLRERYVAPTRLVKIAEAIETPLNVTDENSIHERLTKEQHVEIQKAKIENAKDLINGRGPARFIGGSGIAGRQAHSPVIVLDFGRPLFGCPELTLTADAGAVIDIIYANKLGGGGINVRPHPDKTLYVGDRLITRAGSQTWQLSDKRQFRYLQIVVRRATEPVILEKVAMVSLEYPAEVRGSFECSDPVLTRVWQAGVNTVYLHMEDTHVLDAVRERRQFSALQEVRGGLRAMYAAFGNRLLAEELLLTTKRLQLPDGNLDKWSGSFGDVMGFPEIPYALSYFSSLQFPNQSFGYPLAVWDHYVRFGDKKLLTEHYPALERLCDFYEKFAVYDGLLYNFPGMNFMDWAEHELHGANFFLNAGYAEMLDTMAKIATELEKPLTEITALKTQSLNIRTKLSQLHWNKQRGLFTDSIIDGQQSPIFSVMTNAFAILFRVANEQQQQQIVENVFEYNETLTQPTPLQIGFIAQGLIAGSAVDQTIKMLTTKFGPMIANGDVPTLKEAWVDQDYSGASLGNIHDSACSIMMTLQEMILGISPLEPGFTRCKIAPHLGSLKWAKGVAPTPRGNIRVSWQQPGNDELIFEIETPPDMPAELLLPRPTNNMDLTLNGKMIVANDKPVLDDVRLGDTVRFTLPGGANKGELKTNY
jgi:hypothetical protein